VAAVEKAPTDGSRDASQKITNGFAGAPGNEGGLHMETSKVRSDCPCVH